MTEPTPRAGLIVTEYGAAGLRGAPITVRYERMLAIAHPDHRAALAAELEEHVAMNGALALHPPVADQITARFPVAASPRGAYEGRGPVLR